MISPVSRAEFEDLSARFNVIPIVRAIPLQNYSPVDVYETVTATKRGTFLLESAEHGVWSRYSFVGVSQRGFVRKSISGEVTWSSTGGVSPIPGTTDALESKGLDLLEQILEAWKSAPLENLPPLTSGLVGTLGWDMIHEIESLPNKSAQRYEYPVAIFAMLKDAIVFDHELKQLLLVSNAFIGRDSDLDDAYAEATAALEELERLISSNVASQESPTSSSQLQPNANMSQAEFLEMVDRAKEYVRKGDVFQVVLSQRFDVSTSASAIDVYRQLRNLNPSPYMYLLDFEDEKGPFSVIGSSPEALVKVQNGSAVMHPIAGSRPRGADQVSDDLLAEELTADLKEQAEHLMLVDLARNDLLKVCIPESVMVTEFMQIHKFSHIQHLVSTVEGQVAAGCSTIDIFKATFPAGTLSGAPKPRALEIIEELEADNRGLYGGVVGYFDFAGNADLAIAIRTAVLRDGVAHVQAGAGLVLDSIPQMEYEETRSKASAVIRAISQAKA